LGAQIRVQLPIHISAVSQPEPDLVVARGDERAYDTDHPRGPDCILVIEVSCSSRQRDLRKATLYARAGVRVYWILDLELRRLHVFEGPLPDGTYTRIRVLEPGEDIELPESSVSWKVADLLP
jgi:Uma2 family endonuclease